MWSDSLTRAQRLQMLNESDESEDQLSDQTLPRIGSIPRLGRFNSEEEEIEEESSESSNSSYESIQQPLLAHPIGDYNSLLNYFEERYGMRHPQNQENSLQDSEVDLSINNRGIMNDHRVPGNHRSSDESEVTMI